ncbi:MAG: glycoside hydrolase family protein [Kiritimatiellales bacterium]
MMKPIPFQQRIGHPRKDSGFHMEGYWIWCGSAICGDDGLFHMFASRIPKTLSFSPHWMTNSEVVHAVSETAEGPYRFSDVTLPSRDPSFWDGCMTHNPTIHWYGDEYLLYYTATTYSFPIPTPGTPVKQFSVEFWEAQRGQAIGLARSTSPYGPWKRMDHPVLTSRNGKWDEYMATNPAPLVQADGSVLLGYKSAEDPEKHGWPMILKYGLAWASCPEGPFERLLEDPIFQFDDAGVRIEDAYLWHEDGFYQMILNDLTGKLTGEDHSGVHAFSEDGKLWRIAEHPQAYSRTVAWDDGATTVQGSLERPQLIMQNGHPTHLICATANGPGHFNRATDTWNIVIPLVS